MISINKDRLKIEASSHETLPVPLDRDGMPVVVREAVASLHGDAERRVSHLELELQLVSTDDGQLYVVLGTLDNDAHYGWLRETENDSMWQFFVPLVRDWFSCLQGFAMHNVVVKPSRTSKLAGCFFFNM